MTLNDTSHNQTQEIWMTIVPVTAILGLETLFAFFGNILVLYVFLFHYKVCNFKYFVVCLALIDITSSVTSMPGEMITQLKWYDFPDQGLCKAKTFFSVITVGSEAFCYLTIAVDRYRKVCHPLKRQIKPRLACILCIVIVCVSIVLAIPVLVWSGTHRYGAKTSCDVDPEYVDASIVFGNIYITFFIVTSIFLTVLYIFIIRAMYQKRGTRFYAVNNCKHSTRVSRLSPTILPDEKSKLSCSQEDHSKVTISLTMSQENQTKKMENHPLEVGQQKHGIINGRMETNQAIEPASDEVSDDDSEMDESGSEETDSENNINGFQSNTNPSVINNAETDHHDLTHTADGVHDTNQTVELGSALRNGAAEFNRHVRSNRTTKRIRRKSKGSDVWKRLRRKTVILFILTMIFSVTVLLYAIIHIIVIQARVSEMRISDSKKAAFLFLHRLYLVNHVVNPIVYGFLDPKFKQVLSVIWNRCCVICPGRRNTL